MSKLDDKDLNKIAGGTSELDDSGLSGIGGKPSGDTPPAGDNEPPAGGGGTPLDPTNPNQGVG